MNRPTWVLVIGVILILMGVFGLFGGIQTLVMPKMMEFQKEMMSEMFTGMGHQAKTEEAKQAQENMTAMMEKFWSVPEWFTAYVYGIGIGSLFVSGFYLLTGVWFVQVKANAVKLFYRAAVLALLFGFFKVIFGFLSQSMMGFGIAGSGLFSIVINVVLTVIVFSSDKGCFKTDSSTISS